MIALLQQTSTEQKQQLLQERGPQIMQLLYQILLEDLGLGGAAKSELLMAEGEVGLLSWYVTVTNDVQMERMLRDVRDWKMQWTAAVPNAVAMVLQNLLFESLPESLVDPETARIGRVLQDPLRK
jgi:hypothetical protein